MLITQTLSWAPFLWPTTTAATQYTLFQVYPISGTPTIVGTTNTTSITMSFDDSQALAYQVRPSLPGTPITYGPEVVVFVINYVPCRAWLRQNIRLALADRLDSSGSSPTWADDEINGYIQEVLSEFNLLFPYENETTITLLPPTVQNNVVSGVRNYALPADTLLVRSVEYITPDGKMHLYLKEKPFRGGETTAASYQGYPKLGILLNPVGGRYYPGHYDVYENQIWLDWDPVGNGDILHMRYLGKRALPTSDGDIMQGITPEDMTLLSLGTQMKCWFRVEGQDTRLSRWRGKEDGGNRSDMPTVKHSTQIKKLYDQRVNDRRELRPKTRRLVRR